VLGLRARRSVAAAIMKVIEHAGLVADLHPSMDFGNSRLPRPARRSDKPYRVRYQSTNFGNSRLLRVRCIAACEKRNDDQRGCACHGPFHKPTPAAEVPIEAKFADPRMLVEIERAIRSLRA
jgi:hypothetical protein